MIDGKDEGLANEAPGIEYMTSGIGHLILFVLVRQDHLQGEFGRDNTAFHRNETHHCR
jgi:hypothetical protein